MADAHDYIERMTLFINEIGIPCTEEKLTDKTFLPGMCIRNGHMLYDLELLENPGDLLHEAGHLAMLLPEDRLAVCGVENIAGDLEMGAAEMGAIAWSWAAMKHLGIPAEVVFHNNGYKGGSTNIISNFSEGNYFGVPMLSYLGMCGFPDNPDEHAFPKMKQWLRPADSINHRKLNPSPALSEGGDGGA